MALRTPLYLLAALLLSGCHSSSEWNVQAPASSTPNAPAAVATPAPPAASFQLSTLYPTSEGDHQAVVIGRGEGSVRGATLEGTAHTQVVVATVPGVDTDFAFAPRAVATRIAAG